MVEGMALDLVLIRKLPGAASATTESRRRGPYFEGYESPSSWQAVDRMSYSMVNVGGPAGFVVRAGKERAGAAVIAGISPANSVGNVESGEILAVRKALDDWGVTMIVIPVRSDLPLYDQTPSVRHSDRECPRSPGTRRAVHSLGRAVSPELSCDESRLTLLRWPGLSPGRREVVVAVPGYKVTVVVKHLLPSSSPSPLIW